MPACVDQRQACSYKVYWASHYRFHAGSTANEASIKIYERIWATTVHISGFWCDFRLIVVQGHVHNCRQLYWHEKLSIRNYLIIPIIVCMRSKSSSLRGCVTKKRNVPKPVVVHLSILRRKIGIFQNEAVRSLIKFYCKPSTKLWYQ